MAKIAKYCTQFGISEAAFGRLVMDDNRFVARLRDVEQNVTLLSLRRAEAIMQSAPARRRVHPASGTQGLAPRVTFHSGTTNDR